MGGVLVRPGDTVKCNPGELYSLQNDKGNEDVRVFVKVDGNRILIGTLSKEFELLHSSKTSNIFALDTSTDEDDDSDEEVPLAIPLYPNAYETENDAEKPVATQFRELKNDDNAVDSAEIESGDDEDSNDEDDSESLDEVDGEVLKIRLAETPLRTHVEKKAKIVSSTKRSGYVHVATPKETPSIIDSSKQATGYSCKSCSNFNSSIGLDANCKVNHNAHK
ncbi:hypothetical protein PVAP13_6NG317800 [Panicum virgatum]|uniref:Uncharacterized protein n=1 Tax=Panicum virgatum TaxID=38727 RepID=A0A8T0R4S0_PANVG|nr:hypothetical protein PVAP13_6NG317800 [Panicum virgatum]